MSDESNSLPMTTTGKLVGDVIYAVDNVSHRLRLGSDNYFSVNNRLILEAYKPEALKSKTVNAFASISQKVSVQGLRVLMDALFIDGAKTSTVIQKGSMAYVREEYLHTLPWAKKVLQSDAIEGDFIIVDLIHVEFVKPA